MSCSTTLAEPKIPGGSGSSLTVPDSLTERTDPDPLCSTSLEEARTQNFKRKYIRVPISFNNRVLYHGWDPDPHSDHRFGPATLVNIWGLIYFGTIKF